MTKKCPYLGECGGCYFQNKSYEEQLLHKKNKLKKIFSNLNIYFDGIDFDNIEIIKSEKIYEYRNRVDIPTTINGIGFKKKGSWKKIVPIEGCILFGEKSFYVIEQLKKFISDFKLELWNLKKYEGFLRYIILREGKFTNELMINLITSNNSQMPEEIKNYFEADSIYWCVNDKITDISKGKIIKYLKNKYIKEKLNNIIYFIGPNSFFQTNPYITEKIIKYVSYLAKGKILDAYCGIGTFSIYLAKNGFDVSGFDIDEEAIELAKENASYNNVKINFYVSEDRKIQDINCETLIVDPPRVGLHKNFLKLILKEKPINIIYVSCNPESLVRDLIYLLNFYELKNIKFFDMFPQTNHIEAVAKLEKK